MRGLIGSYQSHYLSQIQTNYFCKQKQHHGACADGLYDEYMFRLSKMLVNISGVAVGILVEFIGFNKTLGPDVNLDFTVHSML